MVFRHLRDVAHLVRGELSFFRRRIKNDDLEVDFVLSFERGLVVIEVTSSNDPPARKYNRLLRVGKILKTSRLVVIHGGVVDVTEERVTSLSLARFLLQPELVLAAGTMSESIPLGQAESQRLEFKGKDALKHLPNVSREVVAMLNSGGGEIWIGLGEEHGRAVRIEPVENAEREISRLRDHLSDAIEPPPIAAEIHVETVSTAKTTVHVLRVSVKPSKERRPYDLREGTARHFLKRIDDRLRSMTREEIITLTKPALIPAAVKRSRKIENARKHQRNGENFWLRIQPVDDGNLELGKDFQVYFSDYQKTGNRNGGWNFVDPYKQDRAGRRSHRIWPR